MIDGTVKWFNTKKGFGFINGDGGPDVFVHFSEIVGDKNPSLEEGESVQYELVQGEKGPKAAKVIRKATVESQ